jgi:chromosome segregation ATPase
MIAKDLKIEAIKTPQGNVPTLNGLETAINAVIDQMKPLAENFQTIENSITQIQETMQNMASNIQQVSDHLAEFLVLLAKINANLAEVLNQSEREKNDSFAVQQATLIELQTILVKLIGELQDNIAKMAKSLPAITG